MSEKQPPKQDPDGPPAYDDASAPPDFDPDSKNPEDELEPVDSSSSAFVASCITPQASILALEKDPPRYATLTIHSWKTLRFVNFPHSVLEAVDGVAKYYYLKGIKWEFEHGQWSLTTGAIAFTGQDGNAGKYLLLAILIRLSQFGYYPQTMLLANSAAYLDKDTYFFKRIPPNLPPPPQSVMRGLSSSKDTTVNATTGLFSKLSLNKGKEIESKKKLPELGLIRSLDQSRYHVGKSYFCLSIWRSNRMTILGCPDDTILESVTSAITVWPEGVESVMSIDPDFPNGWTWVFKGKPWSHRTGPNRTTSKQLLCSLLDQMESRGYDCVMTSRFVRDEAWRDLDTWYFASRA